MSERDNSPAEASFDELAKALASGTVSRRRALRLAGATLLGAPLGFLAMADETEAKRKRNKRRRNNNDQKQSPIPPGTGILGPSFACSNLGTACGLGAQTLVCNCRLTKEGTQTCQNVVNPPNGAAFELCQQTINCPSGQSCDFTGSACRTPCQTG